MAEGKEVYKSEEKQVRYDIVKTDFNSCPIKYRMPGKYKKHICFPFQCDCDNYGDTKEQLIKKVAQILKQQMFILEVYEDYIEAAKNIVEFLGVK